MSAKKVWKIFIPNQNLNCTQKGNRKVGQKRFLMKKVKCRPFPLQKSRFLPLNLDIYLITVKLPYLTENRILNSFNFHGWLSKSDIFWVMAVTSSRISTIILECKFSSELWRFNYYIRRNLTLSTMIWRIWNKITCRLLPTQLVNCKNRLRIRLIQEQPEMSFWERIRPFDM